MGGNAAVARELQQTMRNANGDNAAVPRELQHDVKNALLSAAGSQQTQRLFGQCASTIREDHFRLGQLIGGRSPWHATKKDRSPANRDSKAEPPFLAKPSSPLTSSTRQSLENSTSADRNVEDGRQNKFGRGNSTVSMAGFPPKLHKINTSPKFDKKTCVYGDEKSYFGFVYMEEYRIAKSCHRSGYKEALK